MVVVKAVVRNRLQTALEQRRRGEARWVNLDAAEIEFLLRLIEDDFRATHRATFGEEEWGGRPGPGPGR